MSPPYQRKGGQWSKRQQSYLIDSILNGYDLPKFYVADFSYGPSPLNVNGKRYAVIDGKQRLESILSFATGDLRLGDDFLFIDSPHVDLGRATFKRLMLNSPEAAQSFDEFMLDVIMVITDDESRVNDMFVRLNSGTGLTGAQVRNALGGRWPAVIRAVAEHDFFQHRIAFRTLQGQDLNVAAKLLLLEFRGALQDTKKRQLDKFVRSDQVIQEELVKAQASAEGVERAALRVKAILDRAGKIFRRRDPLLRTQGPVTVYYWLMRHLDTDADTRLRAFLVDFEEDRRANRELSREYGVRAAHVDAELVAYDNFRRNANDARSIEGMYTILLRRFEAWQEAIRDEIDRAQ